MGVHVRMCLLRPGITLSTAADMRRGREEVEEESHLAAGAVSSLITQQTTKGLSPRSLNAYVFFLKGYYVF